MKFYTYLWLREDGTPYYVGKGKDNRAFVNWGHTVKRPTLDRIIVQEFETEENALFAEQFLILFYGRLDLGAGCLRNLTDGGEGSSGYTKSEETRLKISKAKVGKSHGPMLEETKRKIGRARMGFVFSEEAIYKMRKSHTGKKLSEEAKKKVSEFQKIRKPDSKETSQRRSEAAKGNKNCLGHRHSEETKQRISDTKWQRRHIAII